MDVQMLQGFLSMAPSGWEVIFEYEDYNSEEPIVQNEGCFSVDEIVFDFANQVLVLRSVD